MTGNRICLVKTNTVLFLELFVFDSFSGGRAHAFYGSHQPWGDCYLLDVWLTLNECSLTGFAVLPACSMWMRQL